MRLSVYAHKTKSTDRTRGRNEGAPIERANESTRYVNWWAEGRYPRKAPDFLGIDPKQWKNGGGGRSIGRAVAVATKKMVRPAFGDEKMFAYRDFGVLIFSSISDCAKIPPVHRRPHSFHPQTTAKMVCNHHARLSTSSLYMCRGP